MANRETVEQNRIKRDIREKKERARIAKRKRAIRLSILAAVFSIFVIIGTILIVANCISDKEELREAGIAAYTEGNFEEAERNLIASIGEKQWFTEKMDDDSRLYLASCYMKTGEYLMAIDQYNTLLINKSSVESEEKLKSYISYANALELSEDNKIDENTVKVLKDEIDNGNKSVSIILAGYYQTLGYYDDMLTYLNIYKDNYGTNTYIAYQLSTYYLMNDDMDAAVAAINEGLNADDDYYLDKVLFNDVVVAERNLDYQGAFNKISDLVAKYPDNETFRKEFDFLNSRINYNVEPVNSSGE